MWCIIVKRKKGEGETYIHIVHLDETSVERKVYEVTEIITPYI